MVQNLVIRECPEGMKDAKGREENQND